MECGLMDTETHAVGTLTEIQLSRALAREIEQITQQYPGTVPHNVMQAYHKLCEHYQVQMEMGAP